MKSQSSGIRVEQWTAASAQAHIPAPADHACDDGEKCVPSIPSLLETLRAAAAAAAEKVMGVHSLLMRLDYGCKVWASLALQ